MGKRLLEFDDDSKLGKTVAKKSCSRLGFGLKSKPEGKMFFSGDKTLVVGSGVSK